MARGGDPEQDGGSGGPPRRGLARWRKVSLGVAIAVALAGLGLWAYAALTAADAAPARPAAGTMAPHSLAPADGPPAAGPGAAAPREVALWSPAIFRLGFSFVAAFCMAMALRTFARVAAVAIGTALLLLVGLQYAGLIEVRWDVMEERYTNLSGWLAAQTSTFTALVTGYLPSAASAGAGFLAGFTRR